MSMLIFRAWATRGTTIRILLTPIRYVTLHLRDRPGAALLCYVYRPENTVVCVNRGPIRYGFHARAKAIQNSVNIT